MDQINPIIKTDYPDPDVIRVGHTYYMVSTTMHFFPGGVILRSYDLVNWEIVTYVFRRLDSTPSQCLEGEQNIYGKGMWAASLRFHEGRFYICFSAYDTGRTYLFTANQAEGPWERHDVQGVYHHGSLFFDRGKTYIIWGMNQIHMTEMNEELTAPKKNGLSRILIEEQADVYLGYEGSHFYRIHDKYYLFVIHWPKYGMARRTQACFMSDHLEGEFKGEDIFDEDIGFYNQGVAQGGIVSTPKGEWFGVLFQDHGAVGRIPVLVPVTWDHDWPVFGDCKKMPQHFNIESTRPDYEYKPLYASGFFTGKKDENGKPELINVWQWNHEPNDNLWWRTDNNGLAIKTGKISINLTQAVNTLTQRMMYPVSSAEVTLDVSELQNGDYAGLCALQGCYGLVGVTRETGCYYLVMWSRRMEDTSLSDLSLDCMPGMECYRVPMEGDSVTLKIKADFRDMKDMAEFYYKQNNQWILAGNQHLVFKLDHFTGCRYGLFLYSTSNTGGTAVFHDFKYYNGEQL
ncbi:glycoside hydrolase family 43 protein [Lacrimispora sp.]|uniref:glycoside hydrolase family 43 protein n=1 Tax=Lacrimispora sp. TaxID=2719234 RepID=UPI0028AC18F4|nr:family 43 glycosylhydrolase [Lacrimispora sp.]